MRTISFKPNDSTYDIHVAPFEACRYDNIGDDREWRRLGRPEGIVTIPDGCKSSFEIDPEMIDDLIVSPEAVDELIVWGKITRQSADKISHLSNLTSLELWDSGLHDTALPALCGLEILEVLLLGSNKLRGSTLASLAHLPMLKQLDVADNPIDDSMIDPDWATPPMLERVWMEESTAGDNAVAWIAKAPALTTVSLGSAITKRSLLTLAEIPSLRAIGFGSPVEPADLTSLIDSSVTALRLDSPTDAIQRTTLLHGVAQIKGLTDLRLRGWDGGAGSLVPLAHLSALKSLDIRTALGAKVSGGSFSDIAAMGSLRSLTIYSVDGEVSDLVEALGQLTDLEELEIRAPFRDSDLMAISKLTSLKQLSIAGSSITDKGIASLANHPSLREFSLYENDAPLSDAAVFALSTVSELRELWVSWGGPDNTITIAGLEQLIGGASHLEELGLYHCPLLTDATFDILRTSSTLRRVRIGRQSSLSWERAAVLSVMPSLQTLGDIPKDSWDDLQHALPAVTLSS